MSKPIDELQYEYIVNLIKCHKRNNSYMTLKQALYRMNVLNRYVAYYRTL